MTQPDWLPEFVDFDGDWNQLSFYIDRVYAYFLDDFVRRSPPPFQGARVSLRRYPEFDGKSASFWHLVTEGKVEENRSPVIPRCERIRWPRPIIEHAQADPALHVWKNKRRADQRVLIALADFEYVVVLQERRDAKDGHVFFLLLTAYPVDEGHRREKLREESEAWKLAATKG